MSFTFVSLIIKKKSHITSLNFKIFLILFFSCLEVMGRKVEQRCKFGKHLCLGQTLPLSLPQRV